MIQSSHKSFLTLLQSVRYKYIVDSKVVLYLRTIMDKRGKLDAKKQRLYK